MRTIFGHQLAPPVGSQRGVGAWRTTRNLARTARPYSIVWFVAVPAITMGLWMRGTEVPVTDLLVWIVAGVCADSGMTTLNDICDVDTDRLSTEAQRYSRPIAAGAVPVSWAYVQIVVLELLALGAAFSLSQACGWLVFGLVVLGILYSAQPLRISRRAFWSQVFWIVLWPVYYLGCFFAFGGDFYRGLLYIAATTIFMGVSETLAKDIRDLENDRSAGKLTTPVKVGAGKAAHASALAAWIATSLYLLASAQLKPVQPVVTAALGVTLGVWSVKASFLAHALAADYSKGDARALHEGSITTYTAVNLLFIVGLAA